MLHDPWLDRWLPLIAERSRGAAILEIGCGSGADTATLAAAGHRVVAFDLSPDSVTQAQARVPSATFFCRDVRDPFPLANCGVIIASLSLHYFDWQETRTIFARLRAALGEGGVLLCRLNSTADRNFGACGHPEIEANYYRVDGQPKRFFDRAAIDALFADGWRVLSCAHFTTRKYVRSKALWEVVAQAETAGPGAAADAARRDSATKLSGA
jgi:SAM-dependent methyltransferase